MQGAVIRTSVFPLVPVERVYEAVRDVRGFPRWAPGVRRVEVIRVIPASGGYSRSGRFLFLVCGSRSGACSRRPYRRPSCAGVTAAGRSRVGLSASCEAVLTAGRSPSSEPRWSSKTRGYGCFSTALPSRKLRRHTCGGPSRVLGNSQRALVGSSWSVRRISLCRDKGRCIKLLPRAVSCYSKYSAALVV
jgi:hypothetical protein